MISFVVLLFVTNACQKDELIYDTPTNERPVLSFSKTAAEISSDFFDPYFAATQNPNVNPSTASDDETVNNPLLQEIVTKLNEDNINNEFVEKAIEMIGYPIWNKSRIYKDFVGAPNVSLVFTPFGFLEKNEINSMLMTLKIGDDFHFNIMSRDYADFITDSETISQFNLDTDLVFQMQSKKEMYYVYDEKVFDVSVEVDDPFNDVQIQGFESINTGDTPQYTMFIYLSFTCSCESMFNGGSGGGGITILHITPNIGGPGGSGIGETTGSGSGGGSGGGGSHTPNEDDGFEEDWEDEAEFDPNFNDALNGFEDRVINKALAQLGVFNGDFTGEEQQLILGFVEYLDSTNPAFIPNPEQAFHEFLLATNAEYAEFNAAFTTMPPWMWGIIKEMLLDAILDIIIDKLGDMSPYDVNGFQDAARGLAHGDPITFIQGVVDILDNYFPPAKIASAGIKATLKLVDISSAWKVLSKMEQFGKDFVEKFVDTLKNVVGKNWYEKIKWKNNDGAILTGSGSNTEASFFEELINKFGFDMGDVYSNSPLPGIDELILKHNPFGTPPLSFLINGLPAEIKYYLEPAGSGSSNCPTIAIKVGGYTFKIRFC